MNKKKQINKRTNNELKMYNFKSYIESLKFIDHLCELHSLDWK